MLGSPASGDARALESPKLRLVPTAAKAALLALPFLVASALRAQDAGPARLGDRLSVKAKLSDDGTLHAESVERSEDEDASVRGPISSWDPIAGRLAFGPLELELGGAEVVDENGEAFARDGLAAELRVKVKLAPRDGGGLVVDEVQLRPDASSSLRLEGPLGEVAADSIRLLGIPLFVDADTEWKDLEPPPALLKARRAAQAHRLAAGAWLSVKGEPGPHGSLMASSVEPSEDRERTIRGLIGELDASGGSVRIGPIEARLDALTAYKNEKGRDLASEAFGRGDYVKATLVPDVGGALRCVELKQRSGFSEKFRIDGPVDFVTPIVSTEARFRVLGVEVLADAGTDWQGGLVPPRFIADDEDARPAENVSLGRLGTLSGEVRLDWKNEENFDLTGLFADDLEKLRLRTDLEWTFPASRHVAGMLELRAQSEWILDAEAPGDREDPQQEEQLRLGETWVLFRDLAGGRLSVQAGRNRWDDGRDWWYRANLDSIRLFVDLPRMRLELGVGRQQLSPSRFLEHATYHHLRLDVELARRHDLSLIFLDRDDVNPTLDKRFAPTWYGLHAEGRVRGLLEYWAELAWARGTVGADYSASTSAEKLHGFAHDLGVLFHLPGRWKPALTLQHAAGSGDGDTTDGVTRTFRQTGLHDDNGKWAGVTSFRYYGETLDPELANLQVISLGFGVQPRDWLSFELIWHDYRLEEPAAAVVDAGIDDSRRLNLVDKDLGEGWDLIVAWERYEHWEVEWNLGMFSPGAAYLGDAVDAWSSSLKVKWLF